MLSETHLHLVLNHVAILGVVFSFLLALAGIIFRSVDLKKAALFGVVISALATAIVFKTGEGAEESVEELPGVSESSIEEHEEAADVALWMTIVAGAIAAVVLFVTFSKKAMPEKLFLLFLLATLLASTQLVRVGLLGGKIHHIELGSAGTAGAVEQEGEED